MASFFLNIIGQNDDSETDGQEEQLEESVREMAVYALDNGKVIRSLVVVMMGENNNQIYELEGNLQLESIPELIERVQKFTEILE
jgi:geranylgeranyl pyrophosphate synthase